MNLKSLSNSALALFFTAGLLAGALAVAGEPPSAIAIKDARVVPVSGPELPKATVVLRDGLIEAVGTGAPVPPDAWVIDGAGLTVYPGFIDALSTWGIPKAATPPANTRQQAAAQPAPNQRPATPTPRVKGPEDRPQTFSNERAADQVDPSDSRIPAARAAGFTTAATFPNEGIFEGLGALINLAGERGRDMVVLQPIGQHVAFRVGGGGLGRAFPASLMGNISYVRQLYLDLAHYQAATKAYEAHPNGAKRPEYDSDLEGLAQSPRLLLPAVEVQQIDRMIDFGQELKVPFVLYGLHEAFERVDQLKAANVPLIISLKWPEKPRDADPADVPNYRELLRRDRAPAIPGLLAKAGVKFAFYSDGIDSAPDLRKALKKAVDAGLSRADAVRALTLTPAEMYGASDRLGSIDKGKIANLVVMKGELFDDKTTVEYVFIDGVQFRPSKNLQQPPSPAGRGSGQPTAPSEAFNEDGKGY